MGFQFWYEAIIFVGLFLVIVGTPCFFVALWGSKMVNDLGNFPTKSAQIQMKACGKIFMVEIVSFVLLVMFFQFFS